MSLFEKFNKMPGPAKTALEFGLGVMIALTQGEKLDKPDQVSVEQQGNHANIKTLDHEEANQSVKATLNQDVRSSAQDLLKEANATDLGGAEKTSGLSGIAAAVSQQQGKGGFERT